MSLALVCGAVFVLVDCSIDLVYGADSGVVEYSIDLVCAAVHGRQLNHGGKLLQHHL